MTQLQCPPAMIANSGEVLRVACVQMRASSLKSGNLRLAERLVDEAAGRDASVVLLPEKWNAYGSGDVHRSAAERLEDGESVKAMRAWARRHGIVIVGGSITESRPGREKLSNTSVVIDGEGQIIAVYRKIHMFDVDVGGQSYRESDTEERGDEVKTCEVAGWRIGLTICYDVRFPELYRILALRGVELITVPAAFMLYTGKDHWELLLRARAVENQCYVMAAGQWGTDELNRATYGRSMVVDPWGIVLACAPDGDGVVIAEIDSARVKEVRRALPSLANRVPTAYRWPATSSDFAA